MNKRLLIIGVIVVGVILLLIGVFLYIKNKNAPLGNDTGSVPIPTHAAEKPLAPTIVAVPPTYPPTPTITNQSLKEKLISYMPVSTDMYDIEYLPADDEFLVTINSSPFADNKVLANDWFASHGVTDLTLFNIQYRKYLYVH